MPLFERKLVRYPLYVLWAMLAFAISLLIAFPDERVKQIIIVQVEKQLGYKYEVSIADLDVWWRLGVSLEGVKLKERWSPQKKAQVAKDTAAGLPPAIPFSVTIPRIAGRLAPLDSILNGGVSGVGELDFEQGGVISVQGTLVGKNTKVALTFDDVDLMRSGILTQLTGIPGFGSLDGTVELTLDPKGSPFEGAIDLKGSKITIGPADVKKDDLPGFVGDALPSMLVVEVPQTNFGNGQIKATIATPKGGRSPQLTFEQFASEGRDVRTELWGNVSLSAQLARSKADLKMRLQLDRAFLRKNDLGFILSMQQFKDGKGRDNWYGFQLRGVIGARLKFTGSTAASAGPKGSSKAPAPKTKRKVTPKKTTTKAPAKKAPDKKAEAEEVEEEFGQDEGVDGEIIEEEEPKKKGNGSLSAEELMNLPKVEDSPSTAR